MQKILDEFTNLPISTSARWKLRHPKELKERRKVWRCKGYEKIKEDVVRWEHLLERNNLWRYKHRATYLAMRRSKAALARIEEEEREEAEMLRKLK